MRPVQSSGRVTDQYLNGYYDEFVTKGDNGWTLVRLSMEVILIGGC